MLAAIVVASGGAAAVLAAACEVSGAGAELSAAVAAAAVVVAPVVLLIEPRASPADWKNVLSCRWLQSAERSLVCCSKHHRLASISHLSLISQMPPYQQAPTGTRKIHAMHLSSLPAL